VKVSICTHRSLLTPCALKNVEWQLDPYVGCEHCCYYCYALNHAETDWTKEIRIHRNIGDQLIQELKDVPPQNIYLGWNADPYLPSEKKYRQTRQVLELLLEKGFSVTILTKSDLVVRDIDILKRMKNALVGISFAFNNERTRKLFEANTTDNGARIEALGKLKKAGIRTYGMICPVVPHVTNVVSIIDRLEHYSDEIWVYNLSMNKNKDINTQNIQAILNNHFQAFMKEISDAAFSRQHSYWGSLRQLLMQVRKDRGLDLKICL
jgi:DNA repair photolyase